MSGQVPSAAALCRECGMCCDGTVFADVRLSPEDKARIAVHGHTAALFKGAPPSRLKQPCSAFLEGRCAVYLNRPDHCRNFDCALLKKVVAGKLAFDRAQRTVRLCREKANKVRQLLRMLGDEEEDVALMTRFRRVLRHCEAHPGDDGQRDTVAKLSLAAHDLNRALARHIYP